MSVLAVKRQSKVTAAFLKHSGGYCHDGMRLLRVMRGPASPNAKTVLLEDCFTLEEIEMDRGEALALTVVRWPPGV